MAIRADITARKLAEKVRERLFAVVDSSDDAIISKTLDGTISAWNHGAEKVFGYSEAEIVGKPLLMLLPPERIDEEADILARIQRGESVDHFETVRVRKDRTRIDVSVTVSPIRDSKGVVVGAAKIARDITDRKRAQDGLREKERRLAESQRIARIGSWTYDLKGSGERFVWSEELYRLFGVSPETFVPTWSGSQPGPQRRPASHTEMDDGLCGWSESRPYGVSAEVTRWHDPGFQPSRRTAV